MCYEKQYCVLGKSHIDWCRLGCDDFLAVESWVWVLSFAKQKIIGLNYQVIVSIK